MSGAPGPLVQVRGLTLCAGTRVLQRALSFDIHPAEVLVIMGGSGCGKSTLLRHLVGLQVPAAGRICHRGVDLHRASADALVQLRRGFGVMFQAGALWSSMTVGENVMLPMEMFTSMSPRQRAERAQSHLADVGLADAFELDPAALSGGMRKRAAIARALALDPPLLFLDEPSAGLDPPTSAQLDALLLSLRERQGTSIVLVTHELDSIFAVADRALFLDSQTRTMLPPDAPQALRDHGPAVVRDFLRGRVGARPSPAPAAPDAARGAAP
ncbi:ABC transporter ATP-binding protein [Aquabacterium sp. OR-4]|uniref:ABC transporter ATP-binding protein n=1 Tax=Aquabacterium sp. OR-4 TaxID=2978127 RepID=UPI0021B21FE9|nr:ATP-binding cassette domain-containing protein [Aquabacterium sp. OR-4]MDT7835067.1 ATP-binding cassette domain-containing protein [Aquabacterium sp. OR-4]